ncbi:MAG: tyrosine-type recombinase/integrase [Chlamydiales bacterium]|nr:tyrosine-type recombinase/integrase [Chlamydiales bacterium]
MTKNVIPKSNADDFCRRLQPSEKPLYIRDSQIKGLVLRVMPAGSKSWILRYWVRNDAEWKERKTGLGPFRLGRNDVTGLTVPAARIEAERIKKEVKHEGADPIIDKRERAIDRAKQEAGRVTVNDLFDRWAKTDLLNRKDKGAEACRMMKKDVLPFIGDMAIKDVRKAQITEITDRLLQREVNRMAKVVFSLIRQMFRFAVTRDLLEADPTAFVSKKSIGGANIERDRVLSEDEIKELSLKLPEANLTETSIIAVWITLATCCRIGELLKARWAHLDLECKLWRIPAENSKNEREHIIYLSKFALTHFARLFLITGEGEWCFPACRGNGHICPKTITKQVADRQRYSAPHANRSKRTDALILSKGIWKPHDLRRTGATLMNALGVLPEVAERCLNHMEENKVKRIYQRYGYEPEMKQAWERLGNHLNLLICASSNENPLLQQGNRNEF